MKAKIISNRAEQIIVAVLNKSTGRLYFNHETLNVFVLHNSGILASTTYRSLHDLMLKNPELQPLYDGDKLEITL